MDFHGMKRKDLQALCKKQGIPANLKNIEMANRLASIIQTETEETLTETNTLPEFSVKVDGIEDDLVVSKEAKKVRFSPENEIFEFTRSVKKRQLKNVSKGPDQNLQQGGIELRRSKRIGSRSSKVSELMGLEHFEDDKNISKGLCGNDFKLEKVRRRSTRLIANPVESCVGGGTSKAGTLLPAYRSKRLVDIDSKENELAKNTVKDVSMDFEVQETRKFHRKDVQDDHKVEKVPRRSTRFVNDTNTQDRRSSIRLKASAANLSMKGGTSDGKPLCSAKESKEERKTKKSKGSAAVNSQEGELVNHKTKEPLTDCEVQIIENHHRMEVQDVSKVEKVSRRSKRLGNKINVLMDKSPVTAMKCDDLEVEKASKQSRKLDKSVCELLVDGQAQKGEKQPKRTSGNDREDKMLLPSSKCTTLDNMLGQGMSDSPKSCSFIDCERDGASVDNVNDEMQAFVRFARNSTRNDSFEAPLVVEGNLVEKMTDETHDSLVKSSKRVSRRMERDRSAKPGMNIEIASPRSNLTPKKRLDEFEQEETGGANVEAIGSSKKSKTMNQECVEDNPQGMSEDSPSSSETKAAESVMISENVLDSTLEKSVDSSQRINIKELNSELMEGEREEKLERDTVLMAAIEEDKEEVSSPASVQLAVSTPEAELIVPTGHNLVKDIASTAIAVENIKTKEETFICTPRSEFKECSPVEAILENSVECWKEVHSSKEDAKGYLEKEVQDFSECNTENSSAEEGTKIIKVGCMIVGHCVNLTPQFEPEEAGGAKADARGSSKKMMKVNQECLKDKPQGVAVNSPSTSETKATEPAMICENILDSSRKVSGDMSPIRNTQELNFELMEGEREEKHEQNPILMAATKKDKWEASSLSKFLIESSEVKTTLPPASVQLAVELGVPTGHISVKDIVSTVITEEDIKTKEKTLISVAKLAKVEVLENSAECCIEIHTSKDDEKSSLEKDVQATNLHGNFSEYTENSSADEEMGGHMSDGHCVNLAPEKLFDAYTQFKPEDESSSKIVKTVNQECVKSKPQGMVEHSSFTSEIKATDSVMITEHDLDFTPKSSVDISPRRNTQELSCELVEREREESHEQDTVLMAAIEEKEEALSLSAFPIERSEVRNPEAELFVETTTPPALVQLAVSNPEAELSMPTGHIFVKDIASTVIAKENIKINEEFLISIPRSELKEHSFVAKFTEAEGILENSAECWNEIQSRKDDEKGSIEKKIQAKNLHGNISEYKTENSKDESPEKSEQMISCERSCKHNALELRRWSSTGFTSLSSEENNGLKCFEENKIKVLSQPLPRNKDVSVFDESGAMFTTPERNLLLMEQLCENGKTLAADSVTHHNDEAVESHAVVFTTPKQVLLLEDAGIDEAGKEEEDTTTDFPDESDVLNTTERYLKLGGSRQTEARNEGKSIVVELHDESDIATRLVRQFSVGGFIGDRIGGNEESRIVELHYESGTCTSSDTHTLLGNYVPNGSENSGRNKAMEFYEESVFTGLERHELFGSLGQDKAMESEGKKVVKFYEESGLSTGLHRDQPLADSELGEAGWQGINIADKSSLFTSLERQLLYGDSEQKKAVKTGEKAAAELDESAVPNIPEDSELDKAAKSEENKVVELRVDGGIFTSAQKHLLVETDEGAKGDNITAKSHVVSDVFAAAECQSLMRDSEPDEAENKYRENKDVELLGESNTSTNPERHILFGDSGLDGERKLTDYTAATWEESFVFTSPERRELSVNFEPYSAGKEEQKEVDDSVVQESHIAASDIRENTIADTAGIASKVSYSHEFNVGQETAELMPKGSQAEDAVGPDATQVASKKNRKHTPHVDSVKLFNFDIEGAETIMEAERNVSFDSYVLTLSTEGNSETIGETSSCLEVAGTCSMMSEEYGPSTDTQMQINDALEELAITDNNKEDKLIEANVTKTIPKGYEGNILLNSSSGSSVSGKTCILAGTEDEHLGLNSDVAFRNTCEKSGPKFLEDEATGPITTAFEEAIFLTPGELTVQNRRIEKAADEEMIRRETTPSPEERLNESPENKKEYLNADESGMLSETEKQVRREPILIYRTQVKPKRHDIKENAPNSKIVHNLNVTAPRTSKRQALQDLRKN